MSFVSTKLSILDRVSLEISSSKYWETPKSLTTCSYGILRSIKLSILDKGDLKIFGTNGSQEGIFLLPNYELKDIWFPTSEKIKSEPFEAIVENDGKEYQIKFRNEKLRTTATTV